MSTRHGLEGNDSLSGCTCDDADVDRLRDLIRDGADQATASHALWGDRTRPGAIRLWVRHTYAAAFPWLRLPPLETP